MLYTRRAAEGRYDEAAHILLFRSIDDIEEKRPRLVAPAFTDVGDLLIGTQRISTVHRRLARLICAEGPLVMHELPFTIPTLRLAVQWHHINRNDQELRWLLDILIEECATA